MYSIDEYYSQCPMCHRPLGTRSKAISPKHIIDEYLLQNKILHKCDTCGTIVTLKKPKHARLLFSNFTIKKDPAKKVFLEHAFSVGTKVKVLKDNTISTITGHNSCGYVLDNHYIMGGSEIVKI